MHFAIRLVAAISIAVCPLVVSAPPARALPPGFPDLNNFAPVSPDDGYFQQLRAGTSRLVNFAAPGNIVCSFYGGEQPVTAPTQGIGCDGVMPGMDGVPFNGGGTTAPPGTCVIGRVISQGAGYRLERENYGGCEDGHAPAPPYGGKPLGVGQKITYQNVTCAVGADQLTACLDTTSGQHGFVLKPSGSVAF